MSKYKVIIFDWDGTLMDSIGKIVDTMKRAARELDVPEPTDEKAQSVIGLALERALAIVFDRESPETVAKLCKVYSEIYNQDLYPCELFDDALTSIELLKDKKLKLAVATGKRRRGLDRVMGYTNTVQYFVTSRCADETASKPDPLMLTEIIEELGVSVDECLFVGDTIHDMAMAQAIDMDRVGVTFGVDSEDKLLDYQPVKVVDSLTELANWL